jgi:RNA polymerase sigma-B factor
LLIQHAATPRHDPRRAELRAALVTGYLPIARNLARRYTQRGKSLDDLEQVASIGLISTIDRFEPGRGSPFLAYAVSTITGEIRRHFRDKTWSVRVPRRLKDLHVAVNDAVLELSGTLNRAPRPSEIAVTLSISTDEVLEALEASQAYRAGSLDEMLTGATDSATFADTYGELDARLDTFTDSHSLAPHLDALPTRERAILIMRFHGDATQSEIAARIGVSQMHVSRLLSATLERLPEAMTTDDPAPVEPATAAPTGR